MLGELKLDLTTVDELQGPRYQSSLGHQRDARYRNTLD